jgi:hypothetical protein
MSVSNEALLALQKFRERIDQKRDEVTNMWNNPPPPVMLAYGAVVLTSGVLFSALGQWSTLGGYVWGSGLSAVLKLTFGKDGLAAIPGSVRKIKDVLEMIMIAVGLYEEAESEVENLFLQLVQWNLIEAVNLGLPEDRRDELAEILRVTGGDDERTGRVLTFLKDANIDVVKSKQLLDLAVEKSLLQTATVFESRGYQGIVSRVKGMLI